LKKLLTEFKLFEANDMKPADSPDGILTMSGILQRADAPNHNYRIYPKMVLEREIDHMQESIKSRSAVGELDHPESAIVSLKNGSHIVTETWWEGSDLHGKVEVLNTPMGQILESYARRGIKLGISSRGMGSVKKNNDGYDIVDEDYNLICFDFVSNPSTQGAYMMTESKEWQEFVNGNVLYKIDTILDNILKI